MISKRIAYIIPGIFVIAAVIYCYNPFVLFFQNDDFTHVLLSKQGVVFQQNSFRPVCDLSVMLDYKIWKLNAAGYHITNLILHIICSVLVYVFANKLFKIFFTETSHKRIAFIAALLFFVYPFHSEAVFWILGRSAMLGTIFSLLSIIFYLQQTSISQKIFAIIFFALALLSYEVSWLLIIFWWLLFFMNRPKQAFGLLFILTVVFATYLFARFVTIHEVIGNYEAGNFLKFNLSVLMYNYLSLFSRGLLPDSSKGWVLISCFIIVMLAMLYLFLKSPKHGKKIIAGLFLIFIIALLPYLSLGISTNGTEGERFLYLPSVILCCLLSYCLCSFQKKFSSIILFSSICLLYVFVLFNNKTNYETAGEITATTVKEISRLDSNRLLYFINLPQEQHGALIFRKGIAEATELYSQPYLKHVAKVCSYGSNTNIYTIPYHYSYQSSASIYGCDDAAANLSNAYFLFTDSSLIISR